MIGILDSGLGGLSVFNEVRALIPKASILYVADSAWCPYGSRPYHEIRSRVSTIIDFLIQQGAQIIVIACNSATIACVEFLRTQYPIPIVGMEPGIKPATKATQNGIIGVLATEASLAGEKFHSLVSNHAQAYQIITQPCPDFVSLVEKGILQGPEVEAAIKQYISPMAHADTVVLGCTHYPFLKPAISALYPELTLIDTGPAVAQQVLRRLPVDLHHTPPLIHFYTSGDLETCQSVLPTLSAELSNQISPFPL